MSSDNGSEDHGSTVATTSAPQTRAASNPTMTSWLAAGLSPAPVRASIAAPGAPSPLTAAQTPGMAPPPTPTSSAKIAPPAQQQQYVVPERERPPEEPWKDWEKVELFANVLKAAANTSPDLLFDIIRQFGLQPTWDQMTVPHSRSLDDSIRFYNYITLNPPPPPPTPLEADSYPVALAPHHTYQSDEAAQGRGVRIAPKPIPPERVPTPASASAKSTSAIVSGGVSTNPANRNQKKRGRPKGSRSRKVIAREWEKAMTEKERGVLEKPKFEAKRPQGRDEEQLHQGEDARGDAASRKNISRESNQGENTDGEGDDD